MEYHLTQHAKDAIEERGIRIEWLEYVLEQPEHIQPDSSDPDLEHRLGKISEWENRVLRLVVNDRTRPIRIVTAYFDRTMRNKI